MKFAKIAQYVISLLHLVLQMFYYIQFTNQMGELATKGANSATLMTSQNYQLDTIGFTYIGLALLTLAFYSSISVHLTNWAAESRIKELIAEKG